ncbi:hypothetical protein L4D04_06910 [Photobacterium angustum]|uniref:hypothetical protein n=1 Tax=Photobacterium angustum TaxID=661 RepID=UPI003D0B48FA
MIQLTRQINLVTRYLIVMSLLVGVTACKGQDEPQQPLPDIEVSISTNSNYGSLVFSLQAIADDTTITDVVINRGNCRIPAGTAAELSRHVSLKFGKTFRGYSNNCTVNDVKEITVTSSAGTFAFTF